jgi:hypothetical protein
MSPPLPRYTRTFLTTVSHTRRPAINDDYLKPTTTTARRTVTHYPNPQDLRGIPCIAPGVGGTQPHTHPLNETIRRNP